MSQPTSILSDHVRDSFEAIEVNDADGELDGYALVQVPSWYKGGPHFTEAAYKRLMSLNLTPMTPVRSTCSSAWADAYDIRYVPGEGFRYFPEPKKDTDLR